MKKLNVEEVSFLRVDNGTTTNSCSRVPAILTSLTRHHWLDNNKQWRLAKKIKFSLKFCVKKGSRSEIVYQNIKEFTNKKWSLPTKLKKFLLN